MREQNSYRAMVHFLEDRYRRLPSDALGQLLSEMSLDLWDDSEPADPAIAAAWDRAVEAVAKHESLDRLGFSNIRRAS